MDRNIDYSPVSVESHLTVSCFQDQIQPIQHSALKINSHSTATFI